MERQYHEYTCDGCLDKIKLDSYCFPEGWVSVLVEFGRGTLSKNGETVHFCKECWDNNKPPRRTDVPIIVRRFFAWAMKGKEATEGSSP